MKTAEKFPIFGTATEVVKRNCLNMLLCARTTQCGLSTRGNPAISLMRVSEVGVLLFALIGTCTLSLAQDPLTLRMYDTYASIPTEIAGVATFMAAPSGFDPLMATDRELAMYGFPPRPAKTTNPRGYKSWEATVKTAKFRWTGPLKLSNRQLATPSALTELQPSPAVDYQHILQNPDWSGVANVKNIKKYSNSATVASSFRAVEAMFNVPVVEDAYGLSGCVPRANGDAVVAVGIGGLIDSRGLLGSPFLEGGVFTSNPGWEYIIGCFVRTPVYYAQFYDPSSTYLVQEFNVNPGDVIAVQVWNTSATTGYIYIADDTTFNYATYQLRWLDPIIGESAEYIIWRDYVNGVRQPLANYTGVFWSDAQAVDFNNKVYGPANNNLLTWLFEMIDDAGDQVISQPIPYSQSLTQANSPYGDALYMYAENCAANYGCTP